MERARLDTAEGLGRGYRDPQVRIETAHGMLTAFAYVATPDAVDATLVPFDWYRDLVVAGARESGLPDPYVTALASVTAICDPDSVRANRHRRLRDIPPDDVAEERRPAPTGHESQMPRRTVAMQKHRTEPPALRPATEADQSAIVDICKTSITTTYGVFMVLMVLLGGKGTLWGPVIGAVLFHVIKETTWTYMLGWQWVALGAMIIVIVIYLKKGVLGWTRDRWPELFGLTVDEETTAAPRREAAE
ncbi:MAG: gamma-glutamylcyclotransferase [Acidobacteria bacterium]|nr:gamma-glutamylcyclotransferase [Acidobacteriota bacterium]